MKRDWFLCVMQLIQKLRVICPAVHDAVDIDRLFAVNDLVDTYIVTANDLTELSFCQHHIRMQRTGIRECPQQVYGVQNFIDEFSAESAPAKTR